MPESSLAVDIRELSKSFGSLHAVSQVSLTVPTGAIYALIGPNGAGKSTLIKLLVGLLRPSRGEAHILGFSIAKQMEKIKEIIGYLPDDPTAYDYLSGEEFLQLTGNLRGLPAQTIKDRISELKTLFPLHDTLSQSMQAYSRGNRQKVAFLSCLIARPKVLIIDEPVVGLDPESIIVFGKTLREFVKHGGTVFLATHILSFAEQYADMVGIMHEGKIVHEEKIKTNSSLEVLYEKMTK
ncbi:MAG: ABC transporter ATP-binding protein [Candidatus Levybacteria bacterium]|nr:ABC transporter ATP-binding protein [Candidatus Levybacteria bacterium]